MKISGEKLDQSKVRPEGRELVSAKAQFCTFYIDERLFGLNVIEVQEIANPLSITPLDMSPGYVAGVSNLRGQIATAIDLHYLFGLPSQNRAKRMAIICRVDGMLLSLLVDQVGDVVDFSEEALAATPGAVSTTVSSFLNGIYQTPDSILSILDLAKLNAYFVNPASWQGAG